MRRALPLVILLLLAGIGVWTLLGPDDTGPPPRDAPATTERAEPPERRRAQPDPEPPPEPPPPPSEPGEWTVRVLGRDDVPVPGATVVVGVARSDLDHRNANDERVTTGLTDSDGALSFEAPADEREYEAATGLDPQVRAPFASGVATLRVPRGVPMSIRVVDSETGEIVATDIDLVRTSFIGTVLARQTLPRRGSETYVGATTAEPGGEIALKLRPDAQAGYVVASNTSHFANLSIRTRALRVTVPIRPQAKLRVRVLDHLDQPVEGAEIKRVQISGTPHPYRAAATDARGETGLRDVMFIRGNRIRVRAAKGRLWAWSAPFRPAHNDESLLLTVRLPEVEPVDFGGPSNGMIGIGGGAGPDARTVAEKDLTSITLRVVAADGTRPENVRVWIKAEGQRQLRHARTDENGDAVFERLRPGTYHAASADPGMVPASGTVTTEPGEHASLLLRETAGRMLSVLVLDKDGNPFSHARVYVGVDVHGQRIAVQRVVDGVQDVPLLADADGRVILTNAPEGTLVVNASYGALNEGTESDAQDVEITLGGD